MYRKLNHLRMAAAGFLFVSGALISTMLSFTVYMSPPLTDRFTGELYKVNFFFTEALSVFFMAAGSAMSAVVFWGLPDVAHFGLHLAHVGALEVAAFGFVPPAAFDFISPAAFDFISWNNSTDRRAQRGVLFVVLPQVAVLVVPLLFSYLSSLWKSRKHAASEVGEEGKA